MTLFLTSSPGGNYKEDGKRYPCEMDGSNQFLTRLRAALPESPRCLFISSDPADYEMNDSIYRIFIESHRMSGLPLGECVMCDDRNCGRIAELIARSDYIIFCGGHVPTQNAFFHRIGLKEKLAGFQGVIMGISAGTMNSAELVYAQPELEGEALDPAYNRYLTGLGLTDICVLPHFQSLRDLPLDGLRIVEDISLPDSRIHPFYALVDGSYLYIADGKTMLCGEAYYFAEGRMTQISSVNEEIVLD